MKKALILGFVAVVSMAGVEEKFGTGVSLESATAIADVVKNPEAFVGKTIRIDGTATAVCAHMGCWMAVSETDKADSPTVRLKVEDGVIVFPVSAKGKAVSAQGTFERIKAEDAEGKEAASEHAKHQAKPEAATATYQLKATGAIVK
ncbi:MAG: DUF4920 domain-containing protein [Acidobacteria bacterium]|nr:DUF4920 domain-containing protein [Acidobacteriota bacterium]